MKNIFGTLTRRASVPAVVLTLLALLAGGISSAATVDVYLRAGVMTIPANTFNNPDNILMWGFARCDNTFTTCGATTVPGPALAAVAGDTLNIHLINALTGPYVEPSSVIIPGQRAVMTPVWIDSVGNVVSTGSRPAGDVTSRVRSFTAETPADNLSVTTYSWPGVKAGTYLYQSGTHPAVQVQMGLYGALAVDNVAPVAPATGPGRAYADNSTAYDNEVTVLFGEIDNVFHSVIAAGTYWPYPLPPAGWLTSPIDYHPVYFLINGQAYTTTLPVIPGTAPGKTLLIRFLNAGLAAKVAAVQGPYMSVVAEDGNFMTTTRPTGVVVPASRRQYSVLLPPGKTMDAIVAPTAAGDIPVYDRRLNLSNGPTSPGGMLTYIRVQ